MRRQGACVKEKANRRKRSGGASRRTRCATLTPPSCCPWLKRRSPTCSASLATPNIQQTVDVYGRWIPHAKRYVDGLRLWQPTATKTAGQAS